MRTLACCLCAVFMLVSCADGAFLLNVVGDMDQDFDFTIDSDSGLVVYELGLKVTGGTLDASGISFPAAFSSQKVVVDVDYDLRCEGQQFWTVPAQTIVEGLNFSAPSMNFMIELYDLNFSSVNPVATLPEPCVMGLLVIGGIGFVRRRRIG